ncbi:hypothetical protein OHT57_00425 [Streptomyces sp. NBC_00285]|uniref:hypothetical protein n=1 Tax=Streptomyces sp. NBC_00285 TaxID=2975700 RepID=UPI002E2A8428|nr:hypothetical protein [Streptomyces sp. NBC_00285]
MISVVADEFDVPDLELTVVLTGDITASIRARSEIERDFTPERSGGIVKGKTICLARDFSKTVIVLDAGDAAAEEELEQAELLHLVVHEYGHALIGRLRAAACTRPPKTTRPKTPEEVAAIWAYEAADKFRCDQFSNTLLGQCITVTPSGGGESRRFTLADLLGEGYRDAFAGLLDDVHPGWADLVHAYQTHQVGLDEMYEGLLFGTVAMLKLIAHADAVQKPERPDIFRLGARERQSSMGCQQPAGLPRPFASSGRRRLVPAVVRQASDIGQTTVALLLDCGAPRGPGRSPNCRAISMTLLFPGLAARLAGRHGLARVLPATPP